MKTLIPIAIAAIALLIPVSAASADDGGRPINVAMTGAAERPGQGDPDAQARPASGQSRPG